MQQEQEEQKLSAKALSNLSELDLTLTTTSTYFKPEPEKMYVIKINPEEKVEIVKNPKFADKDGNIPTRFEFKIYHVNNGAEQLFTTSKTLCKQIVTELQRGFTVFEIVPRGDLAIYDRRAIRLRQGPTNSRDYTDVKTGVTGRIWKDFNLAYNFRTNWTEKITGLVTV